MPAPPQLQACGPSQGWSGWLSHTQPVSSQQRHFIVLLCTMQNVHALILRKMTRYSRNSSTRWNHHREGVCAMPIFSLLQKLPMGPDEIRVLTTAYEQTLSTLCVKDRNDPLTELIAKKIIKIAQSGVKEPAEICERAIRELQVP
jgi:hypothetical protein